MPGVPQHVQDGMTLPPQTASDEKSAKAFFPCDPSIKNWRCARSACHVLNRPCGICTRPASWCRWLNTAEERVGVLFIYLFILTPPVSLTFLEETLWLSGEPSSCDPHTGRRYDQRQPGQTWENISTENGQYCLWKRLLPPRWDSRSHYSGVTTWKDKIWPQSPTYMFFFPTRANGRHQPQQNIPLITHGAGVGRGMAGRVPLPNQYRRWASATV